jgi:hypothetical protein
VWPAPGPLHLIFGLCEASVKIEGLAFVSSNSENISCVAFLKHKNSKNRELALWHLVNMLIPKMHKNATKCNKTQSKWCINKHGASKIIVTFETYQARVNGNQDVDVHERRTSTFIIKISDRINFV